MHLSRTFYGLAVLALTALVLRIGLVWALSTTHSAPVTYEHGELAENLLAGRGFTIKFLGVTGPTSQQAPLYPALVAGLYAVFGPGSTEALLALQLLQCVAGMLLVLCVVWLAWSLLPEHRTLGWLAGWGAALYPTHVYMVTHVQVALWAALVLTLLAALAAAPCQSGSWRRAALLGLAAGLLLLVEPILVLALPLVGLMFWRTSHAGCGSRGTRSPGRWSAISRLSLAGAVAFVVVAPWIWRNDRVHGELVFIKSTFGYAFWQGNNPASWGTDKIPKHSAEALRRRHDGTLAGIDRALWEARHETLYIDDVVLAPSGYREFAGLTEPARSRLLGARAWRYVQQRPAEYAGRCARRLRYFLLFDETNPKAANRLYRAATVSWLVLALIGTLVLRPQFKILWPTWAIFGVVTLFHTLTIVSARFRIPLEPLSFIWAAGAVAPLASGIGIQIGRVGEFIRRRGTGFQTCRVAEPKH